MGGLTERRDGDVVYLGFNRPDRRNAYDSSVMAELDGRLRELALDTSVGALVLHGDERSFCSGGDLDEVRGLAEQGAAALREGWFGPLLRLNQRLLTFPSPTVAAVAGYALAGGLELALCCDFLVVSEAAKLGDQHINVGLVPGGGATETLVARVGAQRAKELMLTGRRLTGVEAVDIGLALWSAPAERFDAEVAAFATGLAAKRRVASQQIKLLVGPRVSIDALREEQDVAARDLAGDEMLAVLRGLG
ncbi:MAG TPA: enoyl-CoA hydratase/isomerase family protein [Pseudonocardiaceae bacterium]